MTRGDMAWQIEMNLARSALGMALDHLEYVGETDLAGDVETALLAVRRSIARANLEVDSSAPRRPDREGEGC